MSKTSKKQTTQVSTSRRQLLKKLSYSPPLLMCLGSLTKPSVVKATHGGSSTALYWLNNIEEGQEYSSNPPDPQPAIEQFPPYLEWLANNHLSIEDIMNLMASTPPNVAQTP